MRNVWKRFTALILCAALAFGFGPIQYSQSEAATDNTFSVLSLNVAGLPAILSSSDPSVNTIKMSPLLNNYDLVSVQEDFAYHSDLISQVTLPHLTEHSGNVPFGDGMNFMSSYMLYETTRYKWNDAYGFIENGADEMTPKGILYSSMEIAPGFFVDVYDIHTDADCDEGSLAARRSNMEQLATLISQRSIGKAVIVIGDTNSRYTREGDNFETAVLEPCGLTDAWIELIRGGDVPEDGDALMDSENPNSANNEVVDKIWYRSGKNVELQAISYALLDTEFTDENGAQLSDHYPITATFSFTLHQEILTSPTFGGGGGTAFSFIEEMNDSFPQKIAIRAASRLDNVTFTYEDATATVGGNGGDYQELVLAEGEYITSMKVCKAKKSLFSTYRISYIELRTNFGNVLSGGKSNSNTETFTAPEGYAIAGVHGFSASEIDRLGAIYLLK